MAQKVDGRMSVDSKVLVSAASFCSILGVVLLVAGAVIYSINAKKGEDACLCTGGQDADECCKELHSVCDECWCTHEDLSEGYCSLYEHTGSHGGAGLSLAIAGAIVCVVSSTMLVTMRCCKNWAEKHLHVRYPPVTPGIDYRT